MRNIKASTFYTFKKAQDKIAFLLRYAVLAPSTHNTQPWLFKITKDSCEIYINSAKKLAQADPTERNLYISLGCCIENLIIAASYFGVFKTVQYNNGKNNLVATLFFKNLDKAPKADKKMVNLLEAILKRITVRGTFSAKKVDKKILDSINKNPFSKDIALHIVKDEKDIEKIAHYTAEGLRMAYSNRLFRQEMSQWMNSNISQRKEGIPGYSLRMPFLMSLIFPFLVRLTDIGKKVSALNFKSVASAPLIFIITAKKNDSLIWIQVGRLAEHTMLSLYANTIKTSIFVAALEMGNLSTKVQKVIKTEDIPQFLFCAGYMETDQKANPRHDVKSKIIS